MYKRQLHIHAIGWCSREDQYSIPAEHIHPIIPSDVPPWPIKCHLDLTNEEKSVVHPFVWEFRFRSVIVDYEDHFMVYTDGSKTANGVGSPFVAQGGASYSWPLPRTASVYTAELYDVWQALWYCEHQGLRYFPICTDSLSFIDDLDNTGTDDPLLQQI